MIKSWRISVLISIIVLIGVIITSTITYRSYRNILTTSAKSISELSTMGVYSEINSELTKPIYVSLTMAHDSFLKQWLSEEDDTNQDDVIDYLDGVHDKYEYNSIFLVSSSTQHYYHYNGLHKTVSETDEHDVWYYDFLAENEDYALDVDVDEVTGVLTIFVNVKMYDDLNNVIAVVGVGLEMDYVKDLLIEFEDSYDLNIYLTNGSGLIQSSSDLTQIEVVNVFDQFDETISSQILSSQDELVTIDRDNGSQYVISRYIDELDWYLIVTKDTNVLSHFFLDYLYATIIMVIVVLLIVANIIRLIVNKYQEEIYSLAKTDYLTLLLNRRGFNKEIENFDSSVSEALVFILDIDGFKKINDRFGHSEGDKILRHIANVINKEVSKYGKLSRWGGDEFTGFMIGQREELEQLLHHIMKLVGTDKILQEKGVTISLGYTYTDFTDNLDNILVKADTSLYHAKQQKGNAVVQYKDIA